MQYTKAIKIIRAATGRSQSEFASDLGIDASLISRYENGDRKPSEPDLDKISTKYNIPRRLIDLLAADAEELSRIDSAKAAELGKILLKIQVNA